MPEKSVQELPRGLREQYEKGLAALERENLDYAIDLLLGVVKAEPTFLAGREALRRSALKKHGLGAGFFRKLANTAGSGPLLAKAQLALQSQPLEAMNLAEQALSGDPTNAVAHKILAEAALSAGLQRTAIVSLETIWQESTADIPITRRLAEAYVEAGQHERAESVFATMLKQHSYNPELLMEAKNISARRTLNQGGYELLADGTGSFRQALRDSKGANQLEQENRVVKDQSTARSLIEEYLVRLEQEPQNPSLLRRIADTFAQARDYYRALEYYNRLETIPGAMDAAVQKEVTEVTVKRYNQVIEALDPDHPDTPGQRQELEADRDRFILEDCRQRVERYPNELPIRFELAVLYHSRGMISEAIQEFQRAQVHPNRRIPSLLYLGKCFAARGMNDLAARRLQEAIKEKVLLDEEKKDLIHTLGCVFEAMGQLPEAIDQFKQIYEVDTGYRDVAARVEKSYPGK